MSNATPWIDTATFQRLSSRLQARLIGVIGKRGVLDRSLRSVVATLQMRGEPELARELRTEVERLVKP